MKTNLETLFDDLMALCASSEAFYYVDQTHYDVTYRVFTYRLASFTEFQSRNAIECRGHTFRLERNNKEATWVLASLPMNKFWNIQEHFGWGDELDLNSIDLIMDKLDGSLISTVEDEWDGWFLKSKTSFTSTQAVDAAALLNTDEYRQLYLKVDRAVSDGWTVNFEYCAPNNIIVIPYAKPTLTVLNMRNMITGEYLSYEKLIAFFGKDFVVSSYSTSLTGNDFIKSIDDMTGIEGFVVKFKDGLFVKIKTAAYVAAHGLVSNLNSPRRLYEIILMEAVDDIIHIIKDNEYLMNMVDSETKRIRSLYIEIETTVNDFYNKNKELDRKSYAILAQNELPKHLMSLAMNLWLNKENNYKDYMLKKYDLFKLDIEESVLPEE